MRALSGIRRQRGPDVLASSKSVENCRINTDLIAYYARMAGCGVR
jgi:hypothetical protein